jgi:hypothetical protein
MHLGEAAIFFAVTMQFFFYRSVAKCPWNPKLVSHVPYALQTLFTQLKELF